MTTILWLAALVAVSVACTAFGVMIGGASVYVSIKQHHPEAWRVLQADGAEERALKRFAARRSVQNSTAREW